MWAPPPADGGTPSQAQKTVTLLSFSKRLCHWKWLQLLFLRSPKLDFGVPSHETSDTNVRIREEFVFFHETSSVLWNILTLIAVASTCTQMQHTWGETWMPAERPHKLHSDFLIASFQPWQHFVSFFWVEIFGSASFYHTFTAFTFLKIFLFSPCLRIFGILGFPDQHLL